ncbi:hypothetical protein IM816_01875 [Luteibacter flocculans]|uniref:Uncharacterized protein n=1 Tax=Luteibacter flocculans TaxID=2780091 RepID=A0ABY4T1R7_9GAMM|nr:hypothetical protein [Luteibacter flocculans]URL58892.1 hypothetical protein IM816_01875 [Luteibacter flocculans]
MTSIQGFDLPRSRTVARRLIATLLGAALVFHITGAIAGAKAPETLSEAERVQMEQLLTAQTASVVQRQERMDGQGMLMPPTVRFTADGTKLMVELGSGYVPKINGGEFEDHLMEIANPLLFQLESVAPLNGVDFLFGGYDVFHYFPEDWKPTPPQRAPRLDMTVNHD